MATCEIDMIEETQAKHANRRVLNWDRPGVDCSTSLPNVKLRISASAFQQLDFSAVSPA